MGEGDYWFEIRWIASRTAWRSRRDMITNVLPMMANITVMATAMIMALPRRNDE